MKDLTQLCSASDDQIDSQADDSKISMDTVINIRNLRNDLPILDDKTAIKLLAAFKNNGNFNI